MDTSLTWGGIPRWMTAAGNTIDAFEKEKINAFSISAGPTRNHTWGSVLGQAVCYHSKEWRKDVCVDHGYAGIVGPIHGG